MHKKIHFPTLVIAFVTFLLFFVTATVSSEEGSLGGLSTAAGTFMCEPPPECVCDRGIKTLSAQYIGSAAGVTVSVYGKDYPEDFVKQFTNVQPGDILTITTTESRLDNTTRYYINGVSNAEYHTSCSEYILNQVRGSFKIVGWIDGKGNICNDTPPQPYPDVATVCQGKSVTINVLANDSDPDGDLDPTSVEVKPEHQPTKGTITNINPTTGAITYKANATAVGADNFIYTVCDLADNCSSAVVNITINLCPECGDGNLDDGEECDDGNNIDGDGCSSDCDIEEVSGKCYLIADSGGSNGGNDLLTKVDPADYNSLTNEINVGTGTGTYYMEAIAFDPATEILYGANADQLGTLNLATGVFSPRPSTFGVASGANGNETINDVDGLTFDTSTGILYGSERKSGSDYLVKINPATGGHIPDAFGAGIDYVVIDPISGLADVDDIALDPYSGKMYAAINNNQENDRLVIVNKNNGDTTDVGALGVNNIEGLGFDTDGKLYGTRGGDSKKLYEINKSTGVAFNPRTINNGSDYEGFDCFVPLQSPECGDGNVDPGEECDDGNQNNDDGCRNNCTLPECGDGIKDPDEECDDGNTNDEDDCRNNCTLPTCGDGIEDPGEQCDDGNTNDDDGCRNDCTLPECGDGTVDPGEQCDDGNNNNDDDCRNNCTAPYCKDGILDPGEECDDGNYNNDDSCRNDCTVPLCGDGILDVDEECDDGNTIDDDSCRNDCTLPGCGDGILDPGEQCDDGNNNNDDQCRNDCSLPYCGDGVKDLTEECDDGNNIDDDDCNNDCLLPKCGDGIVQVGEQCDDGNDINSDQCRNDCSIPVCGDSILDLNEECDPIGTNAQCASGTCESDCTCEPPPSCGDEKIDFGEQCDPPGALNQCAYGTCNDGCLCPSPPTCGDGNIDLGEECDPPGFYGQCASGICGGNCLCTPPPSCGDGNLDFGEECDPPGESGQCASGLCSGGCTCTSPPTCGDGVLDEGEECDPPGELDQCAYGACGGNCSCPPPAPPEGRDRSVYDAGCGIIFGANEFVLSAQASPISGHGIVQFHVNDPQQFYLEAKNVNRATVVNIDSLVEYPLNYDPDLKLWTGELKFKFPGIFRLKAVVSNEECEYEREINTVFISEKLKLFDKETGRKISTADIQVYEKDYRSNNFQLWNGNAFGVTNPLQSTNGEFSIFLPKGEYYLDVNIPGYNRVNSLITEVPDHSIVTANVELKPKGSVVEQFFRSLSRNDETNNFELDVTVLPGMYLLNLNEQVMDISLHNSDNQQFSFFELVDPRKPTVLYVYSSWNTLSNEQGDMYQSIRSKLGDKYNFVPITTMEPDEVNKRFLKRGEYDIEFLKPEDRFFHDYFSISLPQFFLINDDRTLANIITGPQSEDELIQKINDTFEK